MRLSAEGPVRFELTGAVERTPAQVFVELSQPLATVTGGCFPGGAPDTRRTMRVQRVPGGFETLREVPVQGAQLGQVHLAAFRAALLETPGPCRLTLGSDAVEGLALRFELSTRTLHLEAPTSREAALASVPPGDEAAVLELSRDPSNDWPLLPVQLRQGGAVLTGTFALSTGGAHSQVSGSAAEQAGLHSPSPSSSGCSCRRRCRFDQPRERSVANRLHRSRARFAVERCR